MRKKVGIIKRVSCISLVFLLSINSFAAIVSDNDGAAFITKAEFDALKNDFQSQIDSYNTSIDNKIDGAIASYLAGISLATEIEQTLFYSVDSTTTVEFKSVNKGSLAKNRKFFNSIQQNDVYNANQSQYSGGSTPITIDVPKESTQYMAFVQSIGSKTGDMECFQTRGQDGLSDVVDFYYKKDLIKISNSSTYARFVWGGYPAAVIWDEPAKWATETLELGKTYTNIRTTNFSAAYQYLEHAFLYKKNMETPQTFFSAMTTKPSGVTDYNSFIGKGENSKTTYTSGEETVFGDNKGWVEYARSPSVVRAQTRTFDHILENEDKNIYLFNDCDEDVFIYNARDNHIEPFSDNNAVPSTNNLQSTDAVSDPTSVYLFYNYTPLDSSPYKKEILHFFPKVRIKQEHNDLLATATTKYTNLKQLRNGKLEYKDGTGSTQYTKFYGGLPLFTSSLANAASCKFAISIAPTTASYTGGIKVFVKEGEYPNAFDVSTWSADEKSKLIKLKSGSYTRDTDGGLIIPSNTKVTIEFEDIPEKGKTYFLRFCENGKSYGGKLTYLGECVMKAEK